MHEDIIRYSMEGEISDSNLESHKSQMVLMLESQMKEEGVIPSLDLWPGFTLDYDGDRDVFRFTLSVYGLYYGKEDIWQTAGMTRGTKIMKHTRQAKSRES